MYFVSVIIPTYNRCRLLKRALESVYQQSYLDYEIIVVDDGSMDDTAEMVKQFSPRVFYDYQINKGVSAARNRGIELAKGSWLAFLDSDDEWMPQKLENQINKLKSEQAYRVCHTQEQWIRNGLRVNQMKKHKKTGGWIFKQCLPICAMSPSSIVIHRSIFDDVGVFDISLPACEDYDLWLRITAKHPVLYIDDELIKKYGGHNDQLSMKYWGMDQYRIKALQKIILTNELNQENKREAISMLLKKCKIFKNGALKRDKELDAQYYQQIINKFQHND